MRLQLSCSWKLPSRERVNFVFFLQIHNPILYSSSHRSRNERSFLFNCISLSSRLVFIISNPYSVVSLMIQYFSSLIFLLITGGLTDIILSNLSIDIEVKFLLSHRCYQCYISIIATVNIQAMEVDYCF